MEDKEPLVSICCITYNHENYIRDAIEGFLIQNTSFPFEIIIHDDASTDNTANIIEEYANKYPDLFVTILQSENQWSKGGGSIYARFVYPRARGKYIALCEGDDYWTDPLKLQKQVDFLEGNPEYGLVYTDVDFYNQNKRTFLRSVFMNKHIYQSTDFEDHLIHAGYLAPLTWLFRKEIIINLEFGNHTDGSFALMLEIYNQTKVYFLNEVTAVYRISDGTASRPKDIKKKLNYLKGVFETQKEYLNKYRKDDSKLKKRVFTGAYFRLYPIAIKLNDIVLLDEIEEYMNNEDITIRPIKTIIKKNIKVDNIIELLRKYKIYGLINRFFNRNY